MKKPHLAALLLLALAITPAIFSQIPTGNDGRDYQQTTPGNCDDPLSAPQAGCEGVPQQNQPQGVQPGLNQTGASVPRTLGPGTTVNNLPLGQAGARMRSQAPVPPDLPTEFQKFVAATTGQLLPIYGEKLFRNVPSTFAPSDSAPVTNNYVIGPDDLLRIRIWGQVNFSGNLRVDRSGNIDLPQIGTVHVAGLQFSALTLHLREAVARIFRNFDLSADVLQIRSIQVYVTGQARHPGVYTISSLSSLVDALFASGGPSPQGSLRHILVNREGTTIADFDLYALLVHGDKSHDVRLQPEDVLYIPAVGPQVAITGSINDPGIYELRTGETIRDLIETAGKTSTVASNSRISLERMEGQQYRQAMEFGPGDSDLSALLVGGDILRIYSILPAYKKTVMLRGNVANPGRFAWHPGMHLSDLIPDKDSLQSRDYWWKRSHLGLPTPEFEPIISNLGERQRLLESRDRNLSSPETQGTLQTQQAQPTQESLTNDLTVNREADSNQINPDQAAAPQTGSSGALASQVGAAPSASETTKPRLNDIRQAAPGINWNYAVIERTDPNTLKSSLIPFDLGKLILEHDASQDLLLEPEDTVTIFSQADIRVSIDAQVKYVKLEGEFVRAGYYSVLPDETLRDLVRRAGGFTPKAYLYGSEFTRESTRLLQQQRLNEYVRTVSAEADRGTQELAVSSTGSGASAADLTASRTAAQGLVTRLSQVRATGRIVLEFKPASSSIDEVPAIGLQDGDKFSVPYAPSTVNVIGAVYDQNSFLFEPGRLVSHYLRQAGGPNRSADRRHSFVIRADGSVVSSMAVNGSSFWGKGFYDLRLNPGDTIVVPDKTLHPTALRNVLDWTQVFSQLALGAAAINVL